MVEPSDLGEQNASLLNELDSNVLKLQTILGLMMETARLWQTLSEVRKKTENFGTKLASMREVRYAISAIEMKVTKLMTSA